VANQVIGTRRLRTVLRIARSALKPFQTAYGPTLLYLLFLGSLSCYHLLAWPIQVTDTDLWYHLNSGRYLFTHGTIPRDSFFSFLSPPRPWVDYFWLFQALVYTIFSWGQYYGLLLLRAIIYLALLAVVSGYLFTGTRSRQLRAWSTFCFVLYCLVLFPRFLLVRPHMLTYLFIALFLYILEFHRRRAIVLPVLAVLWCNVHGIAYPVLLGICGAYVAEYFIRRLRGQSYRRVEVLRFLVPTVLAMAAVYLTPHGLRLLAVPLASLTYASRFIIELLPLTWGDLTSFHVSTLLPSSLGVFNVLLITAGVIALTSMLQRTARISHMLLFVGGLLLLTRGLRFTSECALLCLPLLKANPLRLKSELPKSTHLVLLGLLMMVPVSFLNPSRVMRPRYPFSYAGLPQGVVAFLQHTKSGGTVLNDINIGGYLQWTLYPSYRIFADMEVPFLFTDEDLHIGRQVFVSKPILAKMLQRYTPTFISVPIDCEKFPALIHDFPDYTAVWFDDANVLYVHRTQRPDIAAVYALSRVDPFALAKWQRREQMGEVTDDKALWLPAPPARSSIIAQLERQVAIDPDCLLTNRLLAMADTEDGRYERALTHAEAVIRNFPEVATGYHLLGDAWRGLGEFGRARSAYQAALARAKSPESRDIQRALGELYLAHHEPAAAFNAFFHSVDLFSPETPIDELFRLAVLARTLGMVKEADAFLTYLYAFRIGPDEKAWIERLGNEWTLLGIPPAWEDADIARRIRSDWSAPVARAHQVVYSKRRGGTHSQ